MRRHAGRDATGLPMTGGYGYPLFSGGDLLTSTGDVYKICAVKNSICSNIFGSIKKTGQFALESTMSLRAPAGAIRPRLELRIRLTFGAIFALLHKTLGIPFYLTPLFALPFALLGALFHYYGILWAGVCCSVFVWSMDIADGLTTGLSVNHLPPEARPKKKIAIRRFLDTFVVDPIFHLALYGVFILLLYKAASVSNALLVLLAVIECLNVFLASLFETTNQREEFFYEYVLEDSAKKRFSPFYSMRVFFGHLSAYYVYSLFPLVGYIAPIADFGSFYFYLVLTVRGFGLVYRLINFVRPKFST